MSHQPPLYRAEAVNHNSNSHEFDEIIQLTAVQVWLIAVALLSLLLTVSLCLFWLAIQ